MQVPGQLLASCLWKSISEIQTQALFHPRIYSARGITNGRRETLSLFPDQIIRVLTTNFYWPPALFSSNINCSRTVWHTSSVGLWGNFFVVFSHSTLKETHAHGCFRKGMRVSSPPHAQLIRFVIILDLRLLLSSSSVVVSSHRTVVYHFN